MYQLNLNELPAAVPASAQVTRLALSAPTPNPSRGDVSFSLTAPRDVRAQVTVFDTQGRRLRVIHDGPLAAGRHSFTWDGRDAAGRTARPGVYFVRADAPGGVQYKRVIRAQ